MQWPLKGRTDVGFIVIVDRSDTKMDDDGGCTGKVDLAA
jgi:hypothetical protein